MLSQYNNITTYPHEVVNALHPHTFVCITVVPDMPPITYG